MAQDLMRQLARRYLWWRPQKAGKIDPDRLIAQVMDIGDFDDARRLLDRFGEERFRRVLKGGCAGRLRPKSWAYWHYRLGVIDVDAPPPPLPRRKVE